MKLDFLHGLGLRTHVVTSKFDLLLTILIIYKEAKCSIKASIRRL